jgi:hypothetical protein
MIANESRNDRRGLAWTGVAVAIVFPSIVTLSYFVFAEGVDPSVQQVRYAVMKCLQFAFPAVWALLVLRDRLPWPLPKPRCGLALGAGFGLVVTLAMLGLYWFGLRQTPLFAAAADGVQQKLTGLGVDSAAKYVALGVFYSLVHSLLEEYYWRWFVFGQLRRLTRLWPAVLVSAVAFTAHHVIVLEAYFGWTSWATWLFALSTAVGGAFWAWLYHRTGSLWGPWLSHLLIDAGIFAIGYELAAKAWA